MKLDLHDIVMVLINSDDKFHAKANFVITVTSVAPFDYLQIFGTFNYNLYYCAYTII